MGPSDLANAIAIASHYHGSQVDKGGEPYILHPIWVMNQMDTIEEKIVAVLHDVLEDTALTESALRKEIGVELTDDVVLLTKLPGQDYFEYLDIIVQVEGRKETDRCSKVKMADLRHNLDPLRQPSLREKDLLRLQKYHRAYKILRDHREAIGV